MMTVKGAISALRRGVFSTTLPKDTPLSRAVRMYCAVMTSVMLAARHPRDVADAVKRDGGDRQAEVPEGDLVHRAGGGAHERVLPSIQPCSASQGESPVVVEAKSAISTTPETYSGVAVDAMEKIDSPRSSREPSRIPESTPIRSEVGTITIIITQSISQPSPPAARR